jgi:hypothetical protein
MKNDYKHNKSSKGERLGWTSVKEKAEVWVTRDMLEARVVNVPSTPNNSTRDKGSNSTHDDRNLLVP